MRIYKIIHFSIFSFFSADLEVYNKQMWNKLMEGPLISLLQSPEQIACEACDCLANMGPIIFNSLKVTFLIGFLILIERILIYFLCTARRTNSDHYFNIWLC